MLKNWKTRNLILSAFLLALGVTFPIAFHAVGLGGNMLPLQFPVLVAGFVLCPPFAIAVGALTPLVSCLITGMPPLFPALPCLMFEFTVYALAISLLPIKNAYLKLIASLVAGKLCLLLFAYISPAFTAFVTAQLINGLPGMAWQIITVPALVMAVNRYISKTKAEKNDSNDKTEI